MVTASRRLGHDRVKLALDPYGNRVPAQDDKAAIPVSKAVSRARDDGPEGISTPDLWSAILSQRFPSASVGLHDEHRYAVCDGMAHICLSTRFRQFPAVWL